MRIAGVDREESGREEVAIMPESSDLAMLAVFVVVLMMLPPSAPPLPTRDAAAPPVAVVESGDRPGIDEGTLIE